MKDLATHLLYLNRQAHNAHNFASGPSFVGDHALLNDLYDAYDEAFDQVMEAGIRAGEIKRTDRKAIGVAAADKVTETENVEDDFKVLFYGETVLCRKLAALRKRFGDSEGVQKLLDDLAGDSQNVRQYKIEQRLG